MPYRHPGLLVGALLLVLLNMPAAAADVVPAAAAEPATWAIQVEGGTLGFGVSVLAGLNAQWQARLALRAGNVGYNFHAENSNGVQGDELRHHVDADLRSAGLLLDYYPGAARSFFLTAGVLYNDSRIRSRSHCQNSSSCEVGDGVTTLPPNAVITGRYHLKDYAPYLGLGWGNPLKAAGWSWRAEAGVAYIGKVDVDLTYQGNCGVGLFVSPATCQQQVDNEARGLEQQFDDYRFFPLLQLSVAYAF